MDVTTVNEDVLSVCAKCTDDFDILILLHQYYRYTTTGALQCHCWENKHRENNGWYVFTDVKVFKMKNMIILI